MVEYDVERTRQALQYLVNTSYFAHHLRKIRSSVEKPRAMPFKGEVEVLNELLKIGRQNRQALDNLINVVEFKRDDKGSYQREFMAAKRKRDKKVIRLEEMLQGKSLTLDERTAVLLKQYEIWKKERAQFLHSKGDLSWEDRNAAIKDFWNSREAQIDQLTEEAQNAQANFRKKKRVVEVKPPKETAMSRALKQAVDKRR